MTLTAVRPDSREQDATAHEDYCESRPVVVEEVWSHRGKVRRAFSRCAVVVALIAGSLVVVAPAASAYPSWYQPNGCTAPGFLSTWNNKFRSACNRHDVCYDWELNWAGEWGRATCDGRFLANMNATCSGWDVACRGAAAGYYTAVRTFGGPFFNNPWLN